MVKAQSGQDSTKTALPGRPEADLELRSQLTLGVFSIPHQAISTAQFPTPRFSFFYFILLYFPLHSFKLGR